MDVAKVLVQRARDRGEKTAVVHREKRATFFQLNEETCRLAGGLRSLGVNKGDRVALLVPNCYEFVPAYLATLKLGAISVPVDARTKGEELSYILQEVAPKVSIVSSGLVGVLGDAWPGQVVSLGEPVASGTLPFSKLLNAWPLEEEIPISDQEEALYLYTSGTTGEPKAVVLTFRHLDLFPESMAAVLNINENDIMGCLLPMSHISGPILVNELVAKGSTLVIFDDLRPETILATMAKERVSWFHAVPPIFQLLLQVPEEQVYDLSSLRLVAMMGTTVPVPLMKEFARRHPRVPVIQGYGLTETSPLLTLVPAEMAEAKLGSIGQAVPGVEIKLLDHQGREVPEGEMGEIVVQGPQVMKGYFNDLAATAEVIKDGWLYTGDLARCDQDGYYYHVGRKKELIITAGLNVHPSEVETVLAQHPKVAEAAVLGVPDARRGEAIKAVVVLKPGEKLAKKELLAFLRERLTRYKVPHLVEFRPFLPKTATGKVIKGELV